MIRKNTLAALIIAAGLATTGSLAFATQAAQNNAVEHLAQTRISLEQAMAAARQQHADGKISKVELEGEKGKTHYEVELVDAKGQVFELKIDAATGKVLSSKLDKKQGQKNDAVTDLAKARISLEQAMTAATQHHAGGRVTKAELESKNGDTYYEIELVDAQQKVFDVKVSAADGKVLSSKLDEHDD